MGRKTKSRIMCRGGKHTRRQIRGGYLCSATNSKDKYTIDAEIGQGEEGTVYLDRENPNIVIKVYDTIFIMPNSRREIADYKRTFKMSKLMGDLGIGPKIHYYKICRKIITVNVDNTRAGNRRRSQLKARLFTSKLFNEETRLKKVVPEEGAEFSYEAYVPYLVMDKVNGREMTASDMDNTRIMESVYELYRRMYENNIVHLDLHFGNVIIGEDRIYLIDFSSAKQVKPGKMPKLLLLEELKDRMEHTELYEHPEKADLVSSPTETSDYSSSPSSTK